MKVVNVLYAILFLSLFYSVGAHSEEIQTDGEFVVMSVEDDADASTATVLIYDKVDGLDEEKRGLTAANWTWKLQCKWGSNRLEFRTWNKTKKNLNCKARCSHPKGRTDFNATSPAKTNNYLSAWVSHKKTGKLKISNSGCK